MMIAEEACVVLTFTPVFVPQQRKSVIEKEKDVEDDDDDFGDDDSEDDDDEYEETALPWQKRRQQQQAKTSSRLKQSDYGDEEDDEDDEEEPHSMLGKPMRDTGPIVEADLEDYAKITLPRRRLARWCKEPFFKEAIMNCFVRLLIGDHDGKKCYRLCQIVDVKKGKKNYNFPPANPREKPVSIKSCHLSLPNVRCLTQFLYGVLLDSNQQDGRSSIRCIRKGISDVSHLRLTSKPGRCKQIHHCCQSCSCASLFETTGRQIAPKAR